MNGGIVAHTLVAADAERVREFARSYGLVERAATSKGVEDDATAQAYRQLTDRLVEWQLADAEAERRDVVTLAADEREALRQDTARALGYAERHAEGLPATAGEHEVVRSLQRAHADFPKALTRAALTRFRRSAARLRRIEELKGPLFVLGREAAVLLGALESATAPIVRPEVVFDARDGFIDTLIWGLELCLIEEPGAAGAVDLGLGTSPAVAALLGVSGEDLHRLYERWARSAEPTHPFARYPYVPRGRLCAVSAARVVRCDLESTGPIGWAAGDEVAAVARDLRVVAGEQPAFAAELREAASRVDGVAARGQVLIGFIEYLPPEAEGQRQWLTDPDIDGER